MDSITNSFKVYSKRTDGSSKVAPNFTVKEFACQDGSDVILLNDLLPLVCQAVRNWFNYPFTPNSAYRTITHNKAVSGAANSNHIYGLAVDIPACAGKATPEELFQFLDRLCGNSCELILYSWGVHIAVTASKKRLNNK